MKDIMKSRYIKTGILISLIIIIHGNGLLGRQTTISTDDGETRTVIVSKNGKTVYRHSSNGFLQDYNIEYRGDIEISDDDKDIVGISSGGYFELSRTTFGNRRTIVIRESGGRLIREYYEGRQEVDYEPAGRQWLADVLPDVLRSTGIGAESRVKRIYRNKGVDGVMDEIGRIRSDHVKTIYATALLDLPGVKSTDLEKIVTGLSREIDSDHYLSRILIKNVDKFMSNENTAKAFFQGIESLSSDHYASGVLREAIKGRNLSDDLLVEVLNASSNLSSDHYITTVLREVMEQDRLNSRIMEQLINTTEEMSSDHYKTVILKKALKEPDLSREAFLSLMNSVTDMSSDHYITEVLKELIYRNNNLTDDFINDIIQFTIEMSSDHYKHVILKELIMDYDLSDKAFESLMRTVTDMSSDHYASVVLIKALDKHDLSDNAMISIIKSTSRMSSDHYITRVLEEVAENIDKDNDEVKQAFREAVRNIRSDHYYGRLMRKLDN